MCKAAQFTKALFKNKDDLQNWDYHPEKPAVDTCMYSIENS